jgi:hypothetical protein
MQDAKDAIAKYHRNELDGRPMIIEMVEGVFNLNEFKARKEEEERRRLATQNRSHPSGATSSSSANRNSNVTSKTPQSRSTEATSSQPPKPQRQSVQSKAVAPPVQTLSEKFKSMTKETFILPESVSLMSANKNPGAKVDKVDATIINQILFNKTGSSSSSPVTFTVKI